jgi:hypothetical protein
MIEVVVEGLANLGHQTIGHEYRKFFPLVGAIFFFILISNLLGLVPGVGGASSDINTGLAWAIIVFCVYHYAGIRRKGWHYLDHFMGPPMFDRHLARGLSEQAREPSNEGSGALRIALHLAAGPGDVVSDGQARRLRVG